MVEIIEILCSDWLDHSGPTPAFEDPNHNRFILFLPSYNSVFIRVSDLECPTLGVTGFLQSARLKVNHHLVGAIGRATALSSAGLDIFFGVISCIFAGILGGIFQLFAPLSHLEDLSSEKMIPWQKSIQPWRRGLR